MQISVPGMIDQKSNAVIHAIVRLQVYNPVYSGQHTEGQKAWKSL